MATATGCMPTDIEVLEVLMLVAEGCIAKFTTAGGSPAVLLATATGNNPGVAVLVTGNSTSRPGSAAETLPAATPQEEIGQQPNRTFTSGLAKVPKYPP